MCVGTCLLEVGVVGGEAVVRGGGFGEEEAHGVALVAVRGVGWGVWWRCVI